MTSQLNLGGSDPHQNAAEELVLPLLEEVEAYSLIHEAIDQALAERKGVLLVGDKGVGKTVAFREGLDALFNAERQKEDLDASYRPRYVVRHATVRNQSARDVLVDLLGQVKPDFVPRVRGGVKKEDELRKELVFALLDSRVALLAIDEAETLRDDILTVLRDINSDAERLAAARFRVSSADDANGGVAAAGVGILLVGTTKLSARIQEGDECDRRWVRLLIANPVAPDLVPTVYLKWLPQFRAAPAAANPVAWANYIHSLVSSGKPVPISRIENHVRLYYRLMVRNGLAISRVATPFHQDLFEYTAGESGWGDRDLKAS
jgi:hypothetical protein